jgi:hypothetical protein
MVALSRYKRLRFARQFTIFHDPVLQMGALDMLGAKRVRAPPLLMILRCVARPIARCRIERGSVMCNASQHMLESIIFAAAKRLRADIRLGNKFMSTRQEKGHRRTAVLQPQRIVTFAKRVFGVAFVLRVDLVYR